MKIRWSHIGATGHVAGLALCLTSLGGAVEMDRADGSWMLQKAGPYNAWLDPITDDVAGSDLADVSCVVPGHGGIPGCDTRARLLPAPAGASSHLPADYLLAPKQGPPAPRKTPSV